jgi:hypothetical protein
LLHTWSADLIALLPAVRVTEVRPLALFVRGMLWAGRVSLRAVAVTRPLAVADASIERRLHRWLRNAHVDVGTLWRGLLPALLASRAGQPLLLVLEPTPHNGAATILCRGLGCRRRILPVAWRVVVQKRPWPQPQITYLRAMIAEVAAALPPDCPVTLIGDRAVPSAELVDACQAVGWDVGFRLSADARQGHTVRRPDGRVCPIWDLVTGPGQRWASPVAIFKKAGWRTLPLTIRWDRGQDAPWLLVSTQPGGRCACARTGAVPMPRRPTPSARRGAGTSKRAGAAPWIAWIGCCWSCIWSSGGLPSLGCARSGRGSAGASTGPAAGS